jgi:hypothetical protein
MDPAKSTESERQPLDAADVDMPAFWAIVGLPPPCWEPDQASPTVNRQLIQRVVAHECTDAEFSYVASLAIRFRPWMQELQQAAIDACDTNYRRISDAPDA